jgi:O-6-methylguanine DNA methyltransferase
MFLNKDRVITYGIYKSQFGRCVIGLNEKNIVFVIFLNKLGDKDVKKRILSDFPGVKIVLDNKAIKEVAEKIFGQNKPKEFTDLIMEGTDFQKKVWLELLKIPYGKTSTYKEIAKNIGSPNAYRAVGSACGKNKITYIVPCHRVLSSNGKLGGYSGGLETKIKMLRYEGVSF